MAKSTTIYRFALYSMGLLSVLTLLTVLHLSGFVSLSTQTLRVVQLGMAFMLFVWLPSIVIAGGTRLYESADSTADDESAVDKPDATAEELRADADEAVDAAVGARRDGRTETAIEGYAEALELYHAAAAQSTGDTRESIEETIEQLQTDRAALQSMQAAQSSFREALSTAERSFQRAVAAHADDERTLARIRYRQARTQFETALEALDDSETPLLETPVDVPVEIETTLTTRRLGAVSGLDAAAVQALEADGITTVGDLDARTGAETTRPKAVDRLEAAGTVDPETATKLTALSWSHDEDSYAFTERAEITDRHQRSTIGFEAS
ncbi:hypothetical protein [Halohasta salina]|uniref:hypothetical protein n=1 Tax=Halohasta salina TaxID=2961621 RepID=UPI0020A49958|nr:hypothetical protein [Halohasta salina]